MSTPNPYASPTNAADATTSRSRDELLPVAITLIVFSVLWIFLALNGLAFFYISATGPDAPANAFTSDGAIDRWLERSQVLESAAGVGFLAYNCCG